MTEETEIKEVPKVCEWCGLEIVTEPIREGFLTNVLGYYYCSEECMDEHINSK